MARSLTTAARGFVCGVIGVFGMAGVSLTMRRLVEPTAPIGVTHYENVVKVAHEKVRPDAGELDRDLQVRTSEILHLAFGGVWGIVLAMVTRRRRIRPFVHGAVFGTGVWALAFGLYMPQLRLAKSLAEMGGYERARTWASHVGYGVVTALALGSGRATSD